MEKDDKYSVKVELTNLDSGGQLIRCFYRDGSPSTHAEVYADKDWLHVVTDDEEGHAMLNIEALPLLIEVLQNIAQEQKALNADPDAR